MEWHYTAIAAEVLDRLSAETDLSNVTLELLARRGFESSEAVAAFLRPRLANLECPFRVTHMDAAICRLVEAIDKSEAIAVLGDYDVDGVTSTSLLISILRLFGLNPTFFVPRRMEEGYGLTLAAVDQLLKNCNPSLVIALDCGTNSVKEVRSLRERGMDVIIVDHHQSREETPEDCILINPHVNDSDGVPWGKLCTVGLVFKVIHGLVKRLREAGNPVAEKCRLRDYLDLVALGTVADLVPLLNENRILTYYGLQTLSQSTRPGIQALFYVSGLEAGQPVEPVDIAFKLGPRINASGRLADASLPVRMLLSNDAAYCMEVAQKLDAFNRERQFIERKMTQEASEKVEASQMDTPGIVVYSESWHPGVVGIVAGKLARDFNRPSITLGRDGDFAVGSGRSCPGINLQCVLNRCNDWLLEWGGHPMAVGVTLRLEHVDAFREAFNRSVAEEIKTTAAPPNVLVIDAWLNVAEFNEVLLDELDSIRPFGEANPQPIFGVRDAVFHFPPEIFGEGNFRFYLQTSPGSKIAGVAWRKGNRMPPLGRPVELAVRFYRHYWNGRTFPQLELMDWREINDGTGGALPRLIQ